jgi:cytochrome P450 family 144
MTEIPGTMLLEPERLDDPYPLYRRLHDEAPVWRVPGTDVFVVSSFELVADAAARVDDFSSHMRALLYRDDRGLPGRLEFGGAGTDALATADPPMHKMHRDVVFSELVAKRMATLEPSITGLATDQIDKAIAKGSVDFMADIGNMIPITVISWLIGFKGSDPERLLEAAFDSTTLVGGNVTLDQLEILVVRSGEIGAWISGQLHESMQAPREDILGAIARGVSAGTMTETEGVVVLQTLLSAGGESTTSLLGNAVRYLAEHQEMQSQIRSEPALLETFIEEILRLESPFRFLLRSVPTDTTLGDVAVPAGSSVLLFWAAANRDSAAFPQPDEVDLERAVPRRHVAFGRGIHHCVGAPLARLEARVVLGLLLEKTSNIGLDPEHRPEWVESLQVRRHDKLPVLLAPLERP